MVRRVLITGPEATGKSSLCKRLAELYKEPWVPEFAREYLASQNGKYAQADLDLMLKGQLKSESEMELGSSSFLFCDTGPDNYWVWSYYKFKEVSDYVNKQVKEMNYDLVLLLDVDLPWESDPLRENPSYYERREILVLFQTVLSEQEINYKLISGTGDIRIKRAVKAIEAL